MPPSLPRARPLPARSPPQPHNLNPMQEKFHLSVLMLLIMCATSAMGAMKTVTITFQDAPGTTVEDSDGREWTIETNATSTSYDDTYGACFKNFQAVDYVLASNVTFSSPHIKGKIHRLTINASSSSEATLSVNQASYNSQTLSSQPQNVTIDMYAEIDGVFTAIIKANSLIQQISVKSIELVYDDGASPAAETHYEPVTALSQLQDKDEIIITSLEKGVYRAMSVNRGNSRAICDLTWNEDGTINSTSSFINQCPILLEKAGDYWHLRASDGYIYDGSSKSGSTTIRSLGTGNLDKAGINGDVSFTFDNDSKATLSFPRHTASDAKYLYLNKSQSPNYFSCSASSTKLRIYRKVKPAAVPIDVTFKQKFGGWTSVYYQDKNLVVPEAFTAYAYTVTDGEGGTSTPYTTGEVIPMNTAVLLKLNEGYEAYDADGNQTVTVETTDNEGKQPEDNMLLGSEEGGTTTPPTGDSQDYEFFRLTLNASSDPGSIGFYWGAADGTPFTIGAHKAYLALPRPQTSTLSAIPLRIIPYLLGDANGDGRVNIADIMVVINYVIGKNPKVIKLIRSDVNIDRTINVSDVMGIVSIILNGDSH